MRLCVLTSSYPRYPDDGAGSFVRSLCRQLGAMGHSLQVLAPHDGGRPTSPRDPNVDVAFFPYTPFGRLRVLGYGRSLQADVRLRPEVYLGLGGYVVAALAATLVAVRRGGSQALHAHWCVPSGFLAALVARILGIPLVISLHGSDVYLASKDGVAGKAAMFALRSASAVAACSEDLAAKAVALGAYAERTTVVPYGVDVERMDHCAETASSVRSKYGIDPDVVLVVAVGRLVRKKGFEYLLRAWPAITDGGGADARLIVGGDGDLRDELKSLARELGISDRVIFTGSLNWREAGELLAAADIVALPSVRDDFGNVDGLPNVLLEAMAAGKPVVSTTAGGIPLAVSSGENGILVPERSPEALAAAILALGNAPEVRARLGAAARATATQRFAWEVIARQYSAIFEKVRAR